MNSVSAVLSYLLQYSDLLLRISQAIEHTVLIFFLLLASWDIYIYSVAVGSVRVCVSVCGGDIHVLYYMPIYIPKKTDMYMVCVYKKKKKKA
jgi:hypothetical protein